MTAAEMYWLRRGLNDWMVFANSSHIGKSKRYLHNQAARDRGEVIAQKMLREI